MERQPAVPYKEPMFRLAHISDVHLGPLPAVAYRELASKRIVGYVNWHRNRRRLLHEGVLGAILDGIAATPNDHLAITGDLVNLALDSEIEAARLWLEALGKPTDVSVVPGNHDAYVPGAFDRVWGNAVLHHLDLDVAGRELRRVLRPGGVAVFCEPWGENPLLGWARRRLPYPGKERTPDEEPLRAHHVRTLRRFFPRLTVRGFQLLSMARRVLPRGRLVAGLDWCDDMLLTRVPALQQFCRYVVLQLRT